MNFTIKFILHEIIYNYSKKENQIEDLELLITNEILKKISIKYNIDINELKILIDY